MMLLEEIKKLRELEQQMYPGRIDVIEGNGLRDYLKVDDEFGDHHIATVECHVWTGQVGDGRWPTFKNARGFATLRNLAPAMLEVLLMFRDYDSQLMEDVKGYLLFAGVDETSVMIDAINRWQKMAELMEQEAREG